MNVGSLFSGCGLRTITAYECGCSLDALTVKGQPPHPPLTCPIHGAIWLRKDAQPNNGPQPRGPQG